MFRLFGNAFNRYSCPCCGRSLWKFDPFGVNLRPNAQCPKCGSLERHRLLWLYFQHRTNLLAGHLKMLHVAPEPVLQKKLSSLSNLDYVSADLDSPMAEIKMDITDIEFPDHFFDAILCNHVLEHVMDDRKAMSELFRVLKPGGWAILQSPIDIKREKTFEDSEIISPDDRERLYGQGDHVRIYGRDYQERLEEQGFVVKVDDYVGTFDVKSIVKYGLMEDEAIYYCLKSL